MFKKGLSPIVALSLLVVVSVVTVSSFQVWFQSYSGTLYNNAESQDSVIGTQVEAMIGDTLYFNNKYENILVDKISVNGFECTTNSSFNKSISRINVSSCIENITSGKAEIVVYSDKGIFSKELVYEKPPEPYVEPFHFVSVWNTSLPGTSNDNQITLPLSQYNGLYNFNVSWGDGTTSTITYGNDPDKTHTYSTPGVYQVNISGEIKGWYFGGGDDAQKIIEIKKWGPLYLQHDSYFFGSYFHGASNLEITAQDVLNTTGVTSMRYAFKDASSITSIPNIGEWDMSSVTDMLEVFKGATYFNDEINTWDTSNVTNMRRMFMDAYFFNQDLNLWNTSKVQEMDTMFDNANSFNGDISTWDTSKVDDFRQMFNDAGDFNSDISGWNTSNVTNMRFMFNDAFDFNQDLTSWDTSKVTNMESMFSDATSFNGNVSNWNTSKVQTMNFMFYNAEAFNSDISGWNISNVTIMTNMLGRTDNFNQNLSSWDVDQVTSCSGMYFMATSWTLPKPNFTSCSP